MSKIDYKRQKIQELASKLLSKGFRVFISKAGTYGFYTDRDGKRVVSFQSDLGGITLAGNYKTSAPHSTGTGWRIAELTSLDAPYEAYLNSYPPQWATNGHTWKYTTVEQHLAVYGESSGYKELEAVS